MLEIGHENSNNGGYSIIVGGHHKMSSEEVEAIIESWRDPACFNKVQILDMKVWDAYPPVQDYFQQRESELNFMKQAMEINETKR